MRYLKQFLLIIAISFAGELLHMILPLPIPAGIYGMVLLFSSLMTGIIKLPQVRETGKFLIEIMPVMFIPAGTGLITSWGVVRPILIPVLFIVIITTVMVMCSAGYVSQLIIRKGRKTGKVQ